MATVVHDGDILGDVQSQGAFLSADKHALRTGQGEFDLAEHHEFGAVGAK